MYFCIHIWYILITRLLYNKRLHTYFRVIHVEFGGGRGRLTPSKIESMVIELCCISIKRTIIS